MQVNTPGVLAACSDNKGLPLNVKDGSISGVSSGLSVTLSKNGGFTASATAGTYTFSFVAQNSLGKESAAQTVTLTFPTGSNLLVNVVDGNDHTTNIPDYRWIVEEDRTFFVDPDCVKNPSLTKCPKATNGSAFNFGTNFHTSFMPVIATGCTGTISCGSGQAVRGSTVPGAAISAPGDIPLCTTAGADPKACLDPNKRYYISVLPGDAAQPFIGGWAGPPTNCATTGAADGTCGHGMGGAPVPKGTHDGTRPFWC
jgi:hypothetical protein